MTGILNALIAGVSGAVKDTYFNLVSLLLPGNGTNGKQNNAFVDSSTNAFSITPNGDVTQGTFSPFSQTGWGAYFDGSNDTVSLSGTPITTTTWTIEAWVYLTGGIVERNLYSQATGGNANRTQLFFYAASGTDPYINIFSASGNQGAASTSRVTSNQWNHVAIQCNGTNVTFYINGQQSGSSSFTASWQSTAGVIGAYIGGGYLNGYVSNFRITNTNVYSGNFTPSTTPLTNISGTQILTLQNNRFIDNAATPNTLTPNNGVAITPFSPFAPTSSYSAAAVGGSGYFDGSGDYLSVVSSSSYRIEVNTTWTIECWVYALSLASTPVVLTNTTNGSSNGHTLYLNAGVPTVIQYGNAAFASTATISANAWNHIAVVCNSNSGTFYVNGSSAGTFTWGSGSAGGSLIVGNSFNGSLPLNGYVSGVRYVVGSTAVPSGIPTAPPINITNTSLLLNFTNAGVVDATAKNVLETEGNAQISTAQSKWGGGSMYFDGTGDYLYKPYDQLLNQLNGNFTIECWIYPTVTNTRMFFAGSLNASGSSNWAFQITAANKLAFEWVNTTPTFFTATSTANISPNIWTYVAAVKNGGTITLYINGSADGTASPTGTYRNASFPLAIGRPGDYNDLYYTGYIDDFRITIGQARTITASPTAPFPLQ